MPDAITLPLNKGTITGTDPTLLEPGYLQESEGVVYVTGDPAVHKMGGRTAFNASAPASANVTGIGFTSFDNGNDYVTAQVSGSLYSAPSGTGVFTSIRTGLTASAELRDKTKGAGDQSFECNGTDTPWAYKNDNTTYRWGLTAQTVAPTNSLGGTGLTGTYVYWCTEYDSTNGVESATAATGATMTVTPANQTVTVTKPATVNSSATHWRLYRTIASGAFPEGWLVATTIIGTATYADSTTDASLVLAAPYPIVTINEASEGRNFPPPTTARSVAYFEGSIVVASDSGISYSDTDTPHYFPVSYTLTPRPRWGGKPRCVRAINKVLLAFYDHDCFRVNTLPKAADSFFDGGVVLERISNYGTTSPLGACTFSGWGGTEMTFVASRANPMITDGSAFDQAVNDIAWDTLIPASRLSTVVCLDNPDKYRIEVYYNSSASDTTVWRRLDFYYHSSRITQDRGFPELAWTGPHRVPGPACFGVLNGAGAVWSGSRNADGKVYQEESGYSDAAQLVDSAGTVNFRLRTGQVYAEGINSQATATRIFVSKSDTSTGTYSVICNWHKEGDQVSSSTHTVDATMTGATSNDFNRAFQSVDVRITRDDAVYMPPINNVTIAIKGVGELVKGNRR